MIGQGCFPHTPPLRRNPMKRLFTLIPVLVFCLLCAPAALADTVKTTYLDQNGIITSQSATPVTDSETAWSDGWYVAQDDVTFTSDINVTGSVNLILADNCKLTVNGSILVNDTSSLSIYAQSTDDMGNLAVTSSSDNAAIGSSWRGNGGAVHIYGGHVTAINTSSGAAIGSGSNTLGTGVTVTISGGIVNATSSGSGAAIGMGTPGSNSGVCDVTISGGTVNAITQNGSSVAIGGSDSNGSGCSVTLSGGTVIATHNGSGAAIEGNTINITNSTVNASCSLDAGGTNALRGTVIVTPGAQPLKISAGDKEDTIAQLKGSPFSTTTNITDLVDGGRVFHCEPLQTVPVSYLGEDGSTATCSAAQEVTRADRYWSAGWYVVQSDVTIPDNITVTGDVKLILADNYTLTVEDSIVVNTGNTFTVYAQSTDIDKMGKLNVTANTFSYAAIGGGSDNAGIVNIYGGNITARTNSRGTGAGIGGANGKVGGTVNIYGGMVDTAAHYGAAIGGGMSDQGATVKIYGGTVEAYSHSGAAIGSGESGQGGTVNISGGNVTAKSLGTGAAIGGGEGGQVGTVTISGGTVGASSASGAAIGSGKSGKGGTVTISDGNVTANTNGSNYSAAIGDGNNASAGIVNISGGIVNATSTGDGAAIGTGYRSSDSNASAVNISGGTVTAISSGEKSGSAIGTGNSDSYVVVKISDGTVTATSSGANSGSAIGKSGTGSGTVTVDISGGTITATSSGEKSGSAIGKSGTGSGTVTVNISGGTVTAYNTNNNDAVNGTVTINPAGQAIKVLAGNSESDNQQLEGSPFTKVNEITSLLTGKHWFHSEVTSIQLVTGITLDPTTLTLKLGDTTTPTLTATVAPANATNPALRWTSSNDAVVTVDAGTTRMSRAVIITAKAPGTAVITAEATDDSGVKASCTVTVEAAPVSTETPAPTKAPSPTEVPSPTEAPDSTTSSNNSTSSVSATPTATPVPVAQNHTVSTAATAIPQTGDESNPALWLGLLAVSALALGGLAFYKYKHRK